METKLRGDKNSSETGNDKPKNLKNHAKLKVKKSKFK
jgi:hypothetical protein